MAKTNEVPHVRTMTIESNKNRAKQKLNQNLETLKLDYCT